MKLNFNSKKFRYVAASFTAMFLLLFSFQNCTPIKYSTGSTGSVVAPVSEPPTSEPSSPAVAPVSEPSATCSTITYNAPSGTANNIVFTFDKPYVCGQFANGDWWVSSETPGNTVIISNVSPAPVQALAGPGKYVHGLELNPINISQQGFDADMAHTPYNATLDKSNTMPLTVSTASGIQSVVKTVSIGAPFNVTGSISGTTMTLTNIAGAPRALAVGDTISGTGILTTKITAIPSGGGIGNYTITALQTLGTSMITISKPDARPKIRFAAVLTVVSEPIPTSTQKFRPAYFGLVTNKKIYTVSDVDLSQLPGYAIDPNIGSTLIAELTATTMTSVANTFANLRMDHISGWTGRYIHPSDAMPDYGADIANQTNAMVGRLLFNDFDIKNATHEKALFGYLQNAIDLRSMVLGGTRFYADGGHFSGRKLPLLFAEKMFGANGIDFRAAIAAHESNGQFQEDGHTYYSSSVPGLALWGKAGTDSQYWSEMRTGSGSRDVRDPYGYIDGGSPGYSVNYPTIGAQGNSYQVCCTSNQYKYAVVVARMLSLQATWNWMPLFDYADRWVSSGVVAAPDPMAAYDGVSGNYNITYGAGKLGTGRVPLNHGLHPNGGYYKINLGEKMWSWWSLYNPAYLGFVSLTNQELSTVMTSNWGRSHANNSISVSAEGEYRIASDSAGTDIVTNWTTLNGSVTSGQYVQVRRTSSATNLTTSSVTLTIGGFANNFNITTK